MSRIYALTVLGPDRVGIIREITKVLAQKKINIADSSMTRLRREFAMILLLKSPVNLSQEFINKLKQKLPDLSFFIRELNFKELKKSPEPAKIFNITLYGADRIGLVYHLTNLLAKKNVNIVNLQSKILESHPPTYLLILEAEPPKNLSRNKLKEFLKTLSRKLKVNISISETYPEKF